MRAGIRKPVLYSHSPGNLDLYLVVLQQYLDRMAEGAQAAVAAGSTPSSQVSHEVSAYFHFVEENPGGHVLVFESPVPSEPHVAWRLRSAMSACADLVATELRAVGIPRPALLPGLVGAGAPTASSPGRQGGTPPRMP